MSRTTEAERLTYVVLSYILGPLRAISPLGQCGEGRKGRKRVGTWGGHLFYVCITISTVVLYIYMYIHTHTHIYIYIYIYVWQYTRLKPRPFDCYGP